MENLSRDLKSYICRFLSPKDIASLSLTSRTSFAFLASYEPLFHSLFNRDFVPHIRVSSNAEIEKNLSITIPDHHSHMKERIVKTTISKEEAQRFINLELPKGLTWKDLFTIIYLTKIEMIADIMILLGMKSQGKENEQIPAYLVFDTGADRHMASDGLFPSAHTSLYNRPLVIFKRNTISFLPDCKCISPHIKMHYLDFFHQEIWIDNELGRPPAPWKKGACADRDTPPEGQWEWVFEGLCWWSKYEHRHFLIFPLSGIRSIFHICRDSILQEYEKKKEITRKFLEQIVTIECKIYGITEANSSEVWNAFALHLKTSHELSVKDFTTKRLDNSTLMATVTCSRNPIWKYKEGLCIDHSLVDCLKDTVVNSDYCREHIRQPPWKYLTQRRELQRKQEYITYPSQSNLELKRNMLLVVNNIAIHVKRKSVETSSYP
jgi:hypothetical protein